MDRADWWNGRFVGGFLVCGWRNEELYHGGWRRAVELAMSDEEIASLTTLSRSRTELASRVSRAQILLAYRENPSFCAVGQRLGVHHQAVQRCVERALADGPLGSGPEGSCSNKNIERDDDRRKVITL